MSRPADDFAEAPGEDIPGPEPLEPPLGEGDDDPLILWFLSLTPTQRLETAQGFADSVRLLKNGLRA